MKLMKSMKFLQAAIAVLLMLSNFMPLYAQGGINSPRLIYVVSDPSGACGVGPIEFNVTNGKLWGCVLGTWAEVGGGGGGGSITSITGSGGIVITNPTGPVVNVDGSTINLIGFIPTVTSSTLLNVTGGNINPGSGSATVAATAFTLSQYTITAATGANPMVLTVPSIPSSQVVAIGMTISIAGALGTGCSGMNGAYVISDITGTAVTVGYNNTGCTYTASSGKIGANSSASGTVVGCLSKEGEVMPVMPTGAGLLVELTTGPGIDRQAASPDCTWAKTGWYGAKKIFEVVLSATGNGTWGAATAKNSANTLLAIECGSAIQCPESGGTVIISGTADMARYSNNGVWTGSQDMSSVSGQQLRAGISLPATCTANTGAVFVKTSVPKGIYNCDATNTWTIDGGPTPLPTPGTSITLTAPRGYAICTSTCTVTIPVPAAGYEFCALNTDNVSTVITMAAIGSSARYENTARTAYGTAGTGTLVSGGAAADRVCLLGLDSTHYLTVSYQGTWTAN